MIVLPFKESGKAADLFLSDMSCSLWQELYWCGLIKNEGDSDQRYFSPRDIILLLPHSRERSTLMQMKGSSFMGVQAKYIE